MPRVPGTEGSDLQLPVEPLVILPPLVMKNTAVAAGLAGDGDVLAGAGFERWVARVATRSRRSQWIRSRNSWVTSSVKRLVSSIKRLSSRALRRYSSSLAARACSVNKSFWERNSVCSFCSSSSFCFLRSSLILISCCNLSPRSRSRSLAALPRTDWSSTACRSTIPTFCACAVLAMLSPKTTASMHAHSPALHTRPLSIQPTPSSLTPTLEGAQEKTQGAETFTTSPVELESIV